MSNTESKTCQNCFYADGGTCGNCSAQPEGATTEISAGFVCDNWKHQLAKVIFLDVDGVINSRRTCIAYDGYPWEVDKQGLKMFDHVAIDLIRVACEKTGARIILSSTWRRSTGHVNMAVAMHLPMMDSTPEKLSSARGEEIAMWLRDHPEVEQYAIVDDDSDMLDGQLPYFVKVDPDNGLSYKNYLKILELLK